MQKSTFCIDSTYMILWKKKNYMNEEPIWLQGIEEEGKGWLPMGNIKF